MHTNDKIHIVVAETSPVVSAGMTACLRRLPGFPAQASEAHTFEALVDAIELYSPDVVMVNPAFGGVFDPSRLHAALPEKEFKLVAISIGQLNPHTRALYDEEVSVLDDIPVITEKIRRLTDKGEENTDDKEPLSQREKEIITLVAKGLTNKEIADALFLSVHTVITHRRNIARKLEIHSATGLAIYAIVNHLVELSEIKI